MKAYDRSDYVIALKSFRPLAERGNMHAQNYLGLMYAKGHGVSLDYKEAVKWYRRAAEQGNMDAQFNLGVMYGAGKGVLKDYIFAHMWWDIAGSRGGKRAIKGRIIIEKRMTHSQIKKAKRLAREWREKHSK